MPKKGVACKVPGETYNLRQPEINFANQLIYFFIYAQIH